MVTTSRSPTPPPVPSDSTESPGPAGPEAPKNDEFDLTDGLGEELDALIPKGGVKPTHTHLQINPNGFSISRMSNGMIVMSLRSQKPAFKARVRVRVGHIHDPHDLEGTAHLTMHQLFAGSEGMEHTSREGFDRWADSQRLRLEDPRVGMYATEFAGMCTAPQMPVFLDMMHRLLFKPAFGMIIDHAREAVQQERVKLGITDRSERLKEAMLHAHCRHHRIVTATGFPDELRLFSNSMENLTAFHREWYLMSNTVMAAATNMEHLELIAALEKIFVHEGEVKPSTFKPTVVEASAPVPSSQYSELGEGKKAGKMEFILNWVISKNKAAVSAFARDILEKIFTAPAKEASRIPATVEVNRGLEFDTFTIKLKMGVLEPNKAQQLRTIINSKLAPTTSADKDTWARILKELKGTMEDELYYGDESTTSALEQALNDWCLYGKVPTPEERLKSFQEVTIEEVLAFLGGELKPAHCFCATVEQSE